MKPMWIALVSLGITSAVFAQERKPMPVGGADRVVLEKMVMATKAAVESRVTPGAPYSADAINESTQTLADGNRIVQKSTTRIYRDGEGRTRREIAAEKKGTPAEVFINDPVTGTRYLLETLNRVAVKSQGSEQELEMIKKKLAVESEIKVQKMKQKTPAGGPAVQAEGEAPVMKKREPETESLGQQMIEGVLCEGKRTSITIPAGAIGNERPIVSVSERWYSPELGVVVMSKHSDPRLGTTTYRLTNLVRSDPDPALFTVPADYTVKEDPGHTLILRRRMEKGAPAP